MGQVSTVFKVSRYSVELELEMESVQRAKPDIFTFHSNPLPHGP